MLENSENLILTGKEAQLLEFFDESHKLFTALNSVDLATAISLVEKGVLIESKVLKTPKFRSFKLNK